MSRITIICPCYNEEDALPIFYDALRERVFSAVPDAAFEVLLVNDGSKDGTLGVMKSLAERDERVRYVSFSRNFGKEAAIYAGLRNASGDYVAIMDVDLQDPPELIPEMYRRVSSGDCDCVATRRVTRAGEPKLRSWFARVFYRLINRISDTEFVDGARDFRLMRRQMVDAILELPEYHRFSKGLFMWVGFNTEWMEYENVQRSAGETKWSFWKLLLYSLEGVVGFSTAPLTIASFFGILCMFFAFIMIIFIIVRKLIYGDPTSGWPSLVCIITLIGGMQLFCIGILGQYLAKTYLETKNRPIYIAKEIK